MSERNAFNLKLFMLTIPVTFPISLAIIENILCRTRRQEEFGGWLSYQKLADEMERLPDKLLLLRYCVQSIEQRIVHSPSRFRHGIHLGEIAYHHLSELLECLFGIHVISRCGMRYYLRPRLLCGVAGWCYLTISLHQVFPLLFRQAIIGFRHTLYSLNRTAKVQII